jgi:hypothetical protein
LRTLSSSSYFSTRFRAEQNPKIAETALIVILSTNKKQNKSNHVTAAEELRNPGGALFNFSLHICT